MEAGELLVVSRFESLFLEEIPDFTGGGFSFGEPLFHNITWDTLTVATNRFKGESIQARLSVERIQLAVPGIVAQVLGIMALIMRTRLPIFLLALGLGCLLGCASTGPTTTNNVTKAEAIQIASKLVYNMSDKNAVEFLNRHGLVMDRPPGGDPVGSNLVFGLADGGTLVLDFHVNPVGRDEKWVTGGLAEASICNWNDQVVTKIRLKDMP